MSHGPCDAACAVLAEVAVPTSAPRMTAMAAPTPPSLRPLHALTSMPSPCSTLSMIRRLLALTLRCPDPVAKDSEVFRNADGAWPSTACQAGRKPPATPVSGRTVDFSRASSPQHEAKNL